MITLTQLTDLKHHLRKLLQEELCLARFSESEDGDFIFHYEGMRVRMCFDTRDTPYLWFGRVFHWAKKPDADALAALDRCLNEVNHRYKVVKLSRNPKADRDGDHALTASVSLMVEDIPTTSAVVLERYLSLIKSGCKLFWELHRKEAQNDSRWAEAAEAPVGPVVRH